MGFHLFSWLTWEIPFWSIKNQSNKLPGLVSCLSSLFKTSSVTGSVRICGDGGQHFVMEQTSRGFWCMVFLQILVADAQCGGSRVSPQIWISNRFLGDANLMTWELHSGYGICEWISLWIVIDCLSLPLCHYDEISPELKKIRQKYIVSA